MAKPSIDPVVWRPPPAPPRARQSRGVADVRLTTIDLPGKGAEDVVVDADGRALVGVEGGRILRVSPDGGTIEDVADTGGRPMGLEVDPDGGLYVCDAQRGLLHADLRSGAVRTLVDRVEGTPVIFCSNCVLAADGTVYFSESSRIVGLEHYRADLLAHSGTGRLSRRRPDGTVEVLASGLDFANGLVLAPDESWIAVAETGGYRVSRIWLSGAHSGQREALVENMPAFPDNMSLDSDGLMWVALPSPRDRVLDLLLPRAPALRKMVWRLPASMQPKEKKTVWVQAYDLDGRLVHDLQTTHDRFAFATGVCRGPGVVWVASLSTSTLARIELDAPR